MVEMLGLSEEQSQSLRGAVEEARKHPELLARLAELYRGVQAEIDQRKPRCDVSGRCCRFDEYGHKLFVTTLELAGFAAQVRAAETPSTGACPYQVNGLCSTHLVRPFGCRIFFCDPTATAWQQEQYEQFHLQLKNLHEELGVPYLYFEWLAGLRAVGLST